MNEAFGRKNAPYLFVMLSPPSEGMESWFWRHVSACGILKTDVRIVYMIDEPPANAGNKASKDQCRRAYPRFLKEIKESKPKVVLPMGTDAFRALTGIDESIFDARGYLIRSDMFHPVPTDVFKQIGVYKSKSKTGAQKGDPKMKWVTEGQATPLGKNFKGTVIPLFTLDHIRKEQFAVKPAFKEDLKRAVRVVTGTCKPVDENFTYFTTIAELPPLERWGSVVAIDIETHGVDNEVIDLVSFSDGVYTGVLEWCEEARLWVQKLFKTDRIFAVHNSPFDIPRLRANGVKIDVERVLEKRLFDTMFGAVVVQPDLHKSLGRVASLYLDMGPWKTANRNKRETHWRLLSQSNPKKYAAKDAFATALIARVLIKVMKGLGCWNLFMGEGDHPGPGVMATIPELALMSQGGLRTDRERATAMCNRLERRMFWYLKLWTRMFPDVKLTSNQQLCKLVYKRWGLPVQRTKEDGVSIDELAIVRLRSFVELNRDTKMHPGAWRKDPRANPRTFELMLRMRKTSKLLGTYVQPVMLGEETWVHPSYLPASKDDERGGKKMDNKGNTSTGRLASFKPNIQNQPDEVRFLYVPDQDDMCFAELDYRSAELYSQAGMSGDKKLMDDLNSGDMHQRNADRHGITRDTGKNVTYASQYLAGHDKQSDMILEQDHVYVSPSDCLAISEAIWGYYSTASAYKQLLVELCETKGYITNPFGRTRFFHNGRAPAAVDFIPQSIVADIIWCVLKPVAEMARRYGGRLVTTVHDSILLCLPKAVVHEAALEAKKIMEKRFDCIRKGFFIPVEIKVGAPGASWGELEKWKPEEVTA